MSSYSSRSNTPVFEASPSFPPLSTPSPLPASPHPQVMSPPQSIYSSSQDFPPLFFDESEMEVQEVEEDEHADAETVAWEGDISQIEVHLTMEQQIEQVEEQLVDLLRERHNLILQALARVESRLSATPGLDDMLFLMGERVRLTRLLNR
ncbi:hypothetical protein BDA99DRAFT_566787 [Phascolomyces articulosus]|uniref:Uncharacterized protein n=1 Tax=Phascolomyces articulosus TaxID=60185 RepID=A0AAD5JVQ9_9FUNG|nr:hypothetical protein BDA99DRAFT_566787 [Phascolomyces articulosus]